MTDYLYEDYSANDPDWVIKHCINKMCASIHFPQLLIDLFRGGATGGEYDWGIQRWSEDLQDELDLAYFEGLRFYLGKVEHAFGDVELETYCSEAKFKHLLKNALAWHADKFSENREFLDNVKYDLGL
jgi:hypothetical protein